MKHRSAVRRLVPPVVVALILFASFTGFSVRPAAAQVAGEGPSPYAKIVAHIVPVSQAGGRPCESSKALVGCNDMVTSGDLFPESYYAFVCVTDGDRTGGIAGVQFGIQYNGAPKQGVDIFGWNLCATLEFKQPSPPWPASGGGNLITWDYVNKCQREVPDAVNGGVVAVAGYFYLTAYTPDKLAITVRPVDGLAAVGDCAVGMNEVEGPDVHFMQSHLGYVSFSKGATVAGYNPCGTNKPTEKDTWGGVKSREKSQ